MKRALVVQHSYPEFLGSIEKQLENRGIGFTYVRPFAGQPLPASALQYDALWLLGCGWPVTDRQHLPWLDDELRLIRAFERARRPAVGLGFGALLLALAWGGTPGGDGPRAYWTKAHAGAKPDAVAGVVAGSDVLVAVNGEVQLPPAVAPLLVDDAGQWIAARKDNAYALLLRPDLRPGMLEDMVMEDGYSLPDGFGAVLERARSEWPRTQPATDRLVAALIAELDLMRERRKPPVIALQPVKSPEP